ncbi:MAG: matrixin family metalloprotease [Nitrosopumilus sp.]|uniref:M57 family metalloprotease n=1 Tax=Nitrosopumilus sp. TaxID=2024843 RepID=UPI00247DF63F|nr:M57 family metalloprotease [Nitrosopumilus sp.]MCV0392420.1 matrixin family metalloprotease [Nitrosopumilus sp.]
MRIKYLIAIVMLSSIIIEANAQSEENPEQMFNQANNLFVKGEYKTAISIYDQILKIAPNNISTLKMKGIALSNLEEHDRSLKQFFKVLQYKPKDITALTGMGVGFGNLGEYQESIKYFEIASKEKPDSIVINNYKEIVQKVINKFPYTPTKKPIGLESTKVISIPDWVKTISKWWSDDSIKDDEFISALLYLIENNIVQVPTTENTSNNDEKIPDWVKNNAGWWADGTIEDAEFVSGIQYMIKNGFITISFKESKQKSQEQLDNEFYLFERYLRDIVNNISKEKRYIEYPNPSKDVIKKFLRDYVKWNFEEEVKKASENFPNPTYEIVDDIYIIYYKVYINEQPTGLPLDHVSTLENSFVFWEKQELNSNNQKAKIVFEMTEKKHEANVWVTWVVRNIGEGVLGHAHLGKGVVEVTLGDYNCDGSFQLYDVKSVETIMTHELGHSIGLTHTDEKNNIMYPSYTPSYAFCLLS